MKKNPSLLKRLESQIKKEIRLHQGYLAVLKEQRDNLTHFKSEKLQNLDSKRIKLIQDIEVAHKERIKILSSLKEAQGKKLTEFVSSQMHLSEQKVLLPLINQLKSLAAETNKESVEFQSVTQFALNMVHGSISLLWQATQNVTKSYSSKGKVEESYSPTKSRKERILKEA